MKVVSLLPSATELICALGLEDQLVGVTHECDFPASVRGLPKVTRSLIPADIASSEIDQLVRDHLKTSQALYSLEVPTLERLQPDLIVTQTLCNVCAVAEEEVRLAALRLPGNPEIINLKPKSLADVFDALQEIAMAVGVDSDGRKVCEALQARIDNVIARASSIKRNPRVAFLEWLEPPFSSGHWNPELVRLAGGIEGLGQAGQPSRTLTWAEIFAWQPEVVFIACCGFDVERTLVDVTRLSTVDGWREIPAVRSGQVYVADGSQYFNRPGPRLVDSLEMLANAFYQEDQPLDPRLIPAIRIDSGKYGWI